MAQPEALKWFRISCKKLAWEIPLDYVFDAQATDSEARQKLEEWRREYQKGECSAWKFEDGTWKNATGSKLNEPKENYRIECVHAGWVFTTKKSHTANTGLSKMRKLMEKWALENPGLKCTLLKGNTTWSEVKQEN